MRLDLKTDYIRLKSELHFDGGSRFIDIGIQTWNQRAENYKMQRGVFQREAPLIFCDDFENHSRDSIEMA